MDRARIRRHPPRSLAVMGWDGVGVGVGVGVGDFGERPIPFAAPPTLRHLDRMAPSDDPWYRPLGPARRSGHPNCSQIDDGLIVGEYPTPSDARWLSVDLGVGAVVNLQDDYDLDAKFLRLTELRNSYAEFGIELHHAPIPDGDADFLSSRFDSVLTKMREFSDAGRIIYLHCNAGMNRAPTIAIAFLHAVRGLDLEAAVTQVKQRRACLPYMKALNSRYGR